MNFYDSAHSNQKWGPQPYQQMVSQAHTQKKLNKLKKK